MKVIAVVGPTASGKTNIAIELAKLLDGEIISADSRLVYKDFNIGTAKPDIAERQGIIHHLVDVADPIDDYSVSLYVDEAAKKIEDIINRGKVPIITGGTGFYVKALLEGLDMPAVAPNEKYRKELDEYALEFGREALHKKLEDVDAMMAEKLHSNDKFRVIRALEVYKELGIPMSVAQKKKPSKYEVTYVGLNAEDREYLYDRVNRRVHIMIDMGLVDEVKNLIKKYGRTVSLMKTLGYKEICEYLDVNMSLEDAVELLQKNTRNFAKRQLTWFRANKNIHWFYIDKQTKGHIVAEVIKVFNK